MKLITAWIQGTGALLQNRFTEQAEVNVQTNTRRVSVDEEVTPRTQAERSCYRDESGYLYHPGASIARLIREAGNAHKLKGSRRTVKWIVPAAVLVVDETLPQFALDRKTRLIDFEVDARPVVIPSTKGRVMRFRPRLDAWSMAMRLRINEAVLSEGLIRQLLIDGGQQIGIGDYRPEKGGPFGVFHVVEWHTEPFKLEAPELVLSEKSDT